MSFDFKVTVSAYNGAGGVVTIPGTIGGFPVVAIGERVFAGKSTVTSVTVPAGVTNVGNHAFATNANLTGVYFMGNAPGEGTGVFSAATPTVYRLSSATGWGSTFGGRPTAIYAVPTVSVSPGGWLVSPAASTVAFAVSNTGSGTLVYEASEEESWLAIAGGGNGTNSGTVTVSYEANAGAAARTGTVTVVAPGANGSPTRVLVIQEKASTTPSLSISPVGWLVSPGSGEVSFAVTNTGGGTLTYSASEAEPWLTITGGGDGTNQGTIQVTFAANLGTAARTGTVTVSASGATGSPASLIIIQAASGVTLAIAPSETNLSSAAAFGLPVFVAAAGAWTAAVDQAWITITSGGTGSGNGVVAYSVAGNSGDARSGSIVVSDGVTSLTCTVNQAASGGSLEISPTSRSHSAVAESGQTISVSATISWSAASSADWITITDVRTGLVTYGVSANSGAARSSSIIVTGEGITRTFTVNQAESGNSLTISPLARRHSSLPASGQTISVSANVAWTSTVSASWITITAGSSGSGAGTVVYNVASNGGAARSGALTVAGGGITRTFTVRQAAVGTLGVAVEGDFDGDGAADLAVFHPPSWSWHILGSTGGELPPETVGGPDMLPVPADYDGDGLADLAAYDPATGTWHIEESSAGGVRQVQFGHATTIPLPGDYDGDGRADLAVYLPGNGRWYIQATTAGTYSAPWGLKGMIPVPADYDGDGMTDLAVYHPRSGHWFILQSSTGRMFSQPWGSRKDVPVPADYDGDGLADIAVFRRSKGIWQISYSGGGSLRVRYRLSSSIPVPADYDGDGAVDLALYRYSTGQWYYLESSTGEIVVEQWGLSSTEPVLLYPLIHLWFDLL